MSRHEGRTGQLADKSLSVIRLFMYGNFDAGGSWRAGSTGNSSKFADHIEYIVSLTRLRQIIAIFLCLYLSSSVYPCVRTCVCE